MTYKTIKRVSVPNLKLFGPPKIELWAKELGRFSIMLTIWEDSPVGVLLPTNAAAKI